MQTLLEVIKELENKSVFVWFSNSRGKEEDLLTIAVFPRTTSLMQLNITLIKKAGKGNKVA